MINRLWKNVKDHGNRKLISVREEGEVIVLERLAPPQRLHQHQRDQDPWSVWCWIVSQSVFKFYQLLVGVWPRPCRGKGRREEGRPKLRHVCRLTSDLGGNVGIHKIYLLIFKFYHIISSPSMKNFLKNALPRSVQLIFFWFSVSIMSDVFSRAGYGDMGPRSRQLCRNLVGDPRKKVDFQGYHWG